MLFLLIPLVTIFLFILFTKKVLVDFKDQYKYLLTIIFTPIISVNSILLGLEISMYLLGFGSSIEFYEKFPDIVRKLYITSIIIMFLTSLFSERKAWSNLIKLMKK